MSKIIEHTERTVKFSVMYDREGIEIVSDGLATYLTWPELEKIYGDGKTFLAERAALLAAVQD